MTRQILKSLLPLLCGTALISCYGIEEEHYRELAPVTVSGVDEVIYAKATETLRLDGIRIESANDREVACEWAYGKPEGDFPGMADSIYLSDSPTLDYTFNSAGSYVLRLKVDNGESVGFHYYELRVQAGFDEGYLILCNDEEGKGSMAFVKKRSPQEEAEGAQEVWEDLLATINPSYAFRDLRDVYVFSSSSESGVLITSGDEEGSIYHLDPTSLEVTFRLRAMDEYGTRTGRILGEKTSRGHYSYVIGDDGKAYRYEFASDLLAVRQTPYPVKYGYQSYYANTVQGTRVPLMFSESGVVGFPNSNIKGFGVPDGYEVINAAGTRVGTEEYYVIARSTAGEPRKVQIIKSNSGISSQSTVLEYDESRPMLIDRNSTMVPTKVSNNIYYNYDDKIYHWAMLSVTPTLPAEGDRPDITLPEGERIMAICSNAMPSTSATTVDDDLLLIATYNPAATDRKPGSLYIYNLKTLEQVKKYEGICEKPVAVTYKFPTSN